MVMKNRKAARVDGFVKQFELPRLVAERADAGEIDALRDAADALCGS